MGVTCINMKKTLLTIAILFSPIAFAGNWVQVNDWATPLKVNVVSLEKNLWVYVFENSNQKYKAKDLYTFQYKTINKSELFINALCDTFDVVGLDENFIEVDDGGTCYFQVVYNFKKNTFTKLEVNGEA